MNRRRADRPSLHERVHGTPPPIEEALRAPESDLPRFRHCRVTDDHGRLPGLLLEWRRTASGWQGRVVRPILELDAWIVVEEWISAELIEPG